MKAKFFPFICLMFLLSIVACNTQDTTNDNVLNPRQSNLEQTPKERELNDRIAYVRYKKDELELNDSEKDQKVATLNRDQLANLITQIILQSDGFEEVATLITDREVLIAYEENGKMDENDTADIARKTAMSVMPRYFDIYVTNNESLMKDIHSLHNSSTQNRNYDQTIEKIIQEMNKSPQGNDDHR